MSKVSEELSKTSRLNDNPVGSRGGTKSSDINGPTTNRMDKPYDEDGDGKPDYGVSRELSESQDWLKTKR